MSLIGTLKRQGTVSILVIAVFLGLIAAGLSVLYLKNREAALELKYRKKPEPQTVIVVPTRNLFPGEVISPRTVATFSIPTRYVDDNIINANNYPKVKGRRVKYPLNEGKPIPLSSLMGLNIEDFSDKITVGKRGVTIKVDKINSFDGMLRPGNFIDLMLGIAADQAGAPLTPNLDNAESEEVILPLLDNIEVLATGNDTAGDRDNVFGGNITDADFSTITINLYPEQAAMLKSAEEVGRMIATLRNREDKGTSNYELVKPSQLMDLIRKAKNAALARASTDVVTDANGNVIGKVVGDTVYDAEGNVIGKVNENGEVVDANGNVIGKKQRGRVAVGADGKPIGTIIGDKVYDENGNIIGRVDKDGRVVTADGQVIGTAAQSLAVDANGNVIGNVVNGTVYDENGNVIGHVDENGNVIAEDGTVLGSTVNAEDVELDANGKVIADELIGANGEVIGKVIGDKVYDANGNLIGKVDENGNVVDLDGNPMDATVRAGKAAAAVTADAAVDTTDSGPQIYDSMVGGKAEDGTLKVQQQTVE
jgi:Flp pilus assembly protein CpaB